MKHNILNGALLVAIAAFLMSAMCGCSSAQPASRATTVSYTFNFDFGDGAKNTTVTNKMGDGALASADSSGSTETQTATPTLDVKPDVNLNYAQGGGITNRGTGGGKASGVAGVLEQFTSDSLNELKDYLTGKKSGTVTLTKKDGSTVQADCKDGSCTFSDGSTATAADCEACTDAK